MATAGRILILPKGEWNSDATYEHLDLVAHNSRAWLAKKVSTGIEPSETNAEYWHDFLGTDFTTVHGKGFKSVSEDESTEVEVVDRGNTGHFRITDSDSKSRAIMLFPVKEKSLDKSLILETNESGVSTTYKLFGEHNKPGGTYKGNGSSEKRTISIPSMSGALLVWSGSNACLVTAGGAFGKVGTTLKALDVSEGSFASEVYTIATSDELLNADGVTYYYRAL